MSRWTLLCCLIFASTVEAVLWGVRSGPGWLVLVIIGLGLSQFLRWRLERPQNLWCGWLWVGAAGLAASPLLYQAELVHCLAPPLCALVLLLAIYHTVALPQPLEALTCTSPVSSEGFRAALQLGRSESPQLSPSLRKGLLMALPLLLLFGLLFVQADPAFQGFLTSWLGDWQTSAWRLLRWTLWAWLAASVWLQARMASPKAVLSPAGQGDAASWTVALHATNLLFFSFLCCQARYLFAGRAPAGMTLAEYARHGFFELFLASLLVVALVVWVHGSIFLTENSRPSRLALQILLLLTFGLVASSTQRMTLYVENFGLTLTRAYVLATLVGIVLTLVLCCWALATERSPQWLRVRLLLLGMLSLTGVGLTNVECWVARVNLARPEVDLAYLETLSCDIAPALGPAYQPLLGKTLQHNPPRDWREFTYSDYRGRRALLSKPPE